MRVSLSPKISVLTLSLILAACGGGSSDNPGSAQIATGTNQSATGNISGSPTTTTGTADNSGSAGAATGSDSTCGCTGSTADGASGDSGTDGTSSSPDSPPTSDVSFAYDETARFNLPQDVQVDAQGNVYVLDYENKTIRKIVPDGQVSTLPVSFADPQSMVIGADGNLYVSDLTYNGVWKVVPASATSTLENVPPAGQLAIDASGNFYMVGGTNSKYLLRVAPDGQTTTIPLELARYSGIAVDAGGNVYIGKYGPVNSPTNPIESVETILKITPAGEQSVYATGEFADVGNFAFDKAGNLYVAQYTELLPGFGCGEFNTCYIGGTDQSIRKIAPDGTVTTVLAGPPGGAVGDIQYDTKFGRYHIGVDTAGNIYASYERNQAIYKVSPDGKATLYAGMPNEAGNAD